jgi:hypothetical protein
MSVCPSRNCQNDFHTIFYSGVLLKFVDRYQFSLKLVHNEGHFTGIPTRISERVSDLEISPENPDPDAQPKEKRQQIICDYVIVRDDVTARQPDAQPKKRSITRDISICKG